MKLKVKLPIFKPKPPADGAPPAAAPSATASAPAAAAAPKPAVVFKARLGEDGGMARKKPAAGRAPKKAKPGGAHDGHAPSALKVKKLIVKTGGLAKLKLPRPEGAEGLGAAAAAAASSGVPAPSGPVTAATAGSTGLAAAVAAADAAAKKKQAALEAKRLKKAAAAAAAGKEPTVVSLDGPPGSGAVVALDGSEGGAAPAAKKSPGAKRTPPKSKLKVGIKGLTPLVQRGGKAAPVDSGKMLDVLDCVQKHDTYKVFANPVSKEELPDYHTIIKKPMDFTTIRKKVARRKYPTWKLFRADIELLCNNACIYNEAHTVFHQQAKAILEEAKTLVSDCAAGGTMATVLANRDRSEAEKAEQEQLRKEQLRGLRRDKSEKSLLSTPALSSGYETRRGADSGLTGTALRSDTGADREAGSSYRALQTPVSAASLPAGVRGGSLVDARRPLTEEEYKRKSYVKNAPKRQLGALHARIMKSFVQSQASSLPNAHEKSLHYFTKGMGPAVMQAVAEISAKRDAALT